MYGVLLHNTSIYYINSFNAPDHKILAIYALEYYVENSDPLQSSRATNRRGQTLVLKQHGCYDLPILQQSSGHRSHIRKSPYMTSEW